MGFVIGRRDARYEANGIKTMDEVGNIWCGDGGGDVVDVVDVVDFDAEHERPLAVSKNKGCGCVACSVIGRSRNLEDGQCRPFAKWKNKTQWKNKKVAPALPKFSPFPLSLLFRFKKKNTR